LEGNQNKSDIADCTGNLVFSAREPDEVIFFRSRNLRAISTIYDCAS